MRYLVIDNTKMLPVRGVYCPGTQAVQSTRSLSAEEIRATALWLGINAGRKLLDAFELKLINDGALRVSPHDENGFAHPYDCEAIECFRTDAGLRIVWQVTMQCIECDGTGYLGNASGLIDDEDLCFSCEDGYVVGDEVVTDMDGLVVPDEA